MEEKIRQFLMQELHIEFCDGIDADSDLFELGLIDSRSYIEIIRFIETEFALKLTNEQILSNVFCSLSGMSSLVCAARGQLLSNLGTTV